MECFHEVLRKIWFISGNIILLITFILMLFVVNKSKSFIEIIFGTLWIIQLIVMCTSLIIAGIVLIINFDIYGNRR